MISTNKPKSITVVVLDRETKKSRSLTVYSSNIDEVYKVVANAFKRKG